MKKLLFILIFVFLSSIAVADHTTIIGSDELKVIRISKSHAIGLFSGMKKMLRGEIIKVYLPNLKSNVTRELVENVLGLNYNKFVDTFHSRSSVLKGNLPIILPSTEIMEFIMSTTDRPAIGYISNGLQPFVIGDSEGRIILIEIIHE